MAKTTVNGPVGSSLQDAIVRGLQARVTELERELALTQARTLETLIEREARIAELEDKLAALTEPGELTDEGIIQEWKNGAEEIFESGPEDFLTRDHLILAVRRCLALDRASRSALTEK